MADEIERLKDACAALDTERTTRESLKDGYAALYTEKMQLQSDAEALRAERDQALTRAVTAETHAAELTLELAEALRWTQRYDAIDVVHARDKAAKSGDDDAHDNLCHILDDHRRAEMWRQDALKNSADAGRLLRERNEVQRRASEAWKVVGDLSVKLAQMERDFNAEHDLYLEMRGALAEANARVDEIEARAQSRMSELVQQLDQMGLPSPSPAVGSTDLIAAQLQIAALIGERDEAEARVANLESEIGNWKILHAVKTQDRDDWRARVAELEAQLDGARTLECVCGCRTGGGCERADAGCQCVPGCQCADVGNDRAAARPAPAAALSRPTGESNVGR